MGKSHLIKTVRHLLHTDCPDDTVVLVTAPTGTAAHNINGDTIHHALSLPVQKGTFFEYKPLSHEKKQKLANCLCHIKYLIIDEVSMIGYSTFQYVHQRLSDIFDCTSLIIIQPLSGICRCVVAILDLGERFWKRGFGHRAPPRTAKCRAGGGCGRGAPSRLGATRNNFEILSAKFCDLMHILCFNCHYNSTT